MARRRTTMNRLVLLVVRLIVGGVFLYAGWLKARDPGAFIRDLWGYRMLPDSAAYAVAAFVPYLEIVAGLALIAGRQRQGAHLLLGAMLVVFIVAVGAAWARGLDIACGCFGASPEGARADYPWLIGRDLALLAGVALSARLKTPPPPQP